jgi:hypothetical protein
MDCCQFPKNKYFESLFLKLTVSLVIQNWSGTDAIPINFAFGKETFEVWSRLNLLVKHTYVFTVPVYWGLFDCFHILNFLLLYLTLSVTVLLHFFIYIILPVFTTTAFYLQCPYISA